MKFFALLFAIMALIYSTVAVKDPVCALAHSKNGENGMSCAAYMPSYSYKADTNECVFFVYGGCIGNDNRFDKIDECQKKCVE